jgi:putative peptidoglycan lipid II flippase
VVALLTTGPLAGMAPLARAWAELGVAVVLGGPVTVLVMRLIGVREVGVVLKRLERLVDRGKSRRGTRR